MTPAERQELEACLKRASEILYKNTQPELLSNLEEIETTVRSQVLEYVSPQITLFLSTKRRELTEEKREK
jgi:hypothetical protein